MNDCSKQDMKRVWQDQELDSEGISLDQICVKASRFQRSIWWRNLCEYVLTGVGVTPFAFYIWYFDTPLVRVGSALTIIGLLSGVIRVHRRGSAKTPPQDLGSTMCLKFHRQELERQRDLLQGIWRWHILPVVPGLVVGVFAGAMELAVPWSRLVRFVAIGGVVAWLLGSLNKRAARKLQAQSDALSALEQEN